MEVLMTDYFNNGLSLLKLTATVGYRVRIVAKYVQFAKKLFCNERSIPCHTTLSPSDSEYFTSSEQAAVISACTNHVPDQLPFYLYYSSPYDAVNLIQTFGCDSVEEYGTDKIMAFSNAIPTVSSVRTLISNTVPTLSTTANTSLDFCNFSDTNLVYKRDGFIYPTSMINSFLFKNSINGVIRWTGDSTNIKFELSLNFYLSRSTTISFIIYKNNSSLFSRSNYISSNRNTDMMFTKIVQATTNDEFKIYVEGINGSDRTLYISNIEFIAINLGGN